MERDPPRLRDGELGSELEGLRVSSFASYDVQTGANRFEQLVQSGRAAPWSTGKLVVIAGGVGGLVLAIALALGGASPSGPKETAAGSRAAVLEQGAPTDDPVTPESAPSISSPSPPSSDTTPKPRPTPLEEPLQTAPEEPSVRDTAPANTERATSARARAPRTSPAPHPPEVDDRIKREIEHTDRMRRALEDDPSRALALAREGERMFAQGMFTMERKGHEVLAMSALGRKDEAQRLGQAFLKRWPKGPLSERVRRAIDGW